jgi:ferredoxin-NADP reductase
MEGTAVHGRLSWKLGTLVARVAETPKAMSLMFDLPRWPGHLAGQHVDVRLTAKDCYQAERSYSIASAPGEEHVTITVDRLPDGEVSPFLTDELMLGETIEIRGPIGGFFVWDRSQGGPILLIGGGSGVVPMRSMLRHWANLGDQPTCARLLYSARALEDVIYQRELTELGALGNVDVQIALTREWARGLEWAPRKDRQDGPRSLRVVLRADLHLRPDAVRGSRIGHAGRARPRSVSNQDGAVRPDRHLILLPDASPGKIDDAALISRDPLEGWRRGASRRQTEPGRAPRGWRCQGWSASLRRQRQPNPSYRPGAARGLSCRRREGCRCG